MRERFRYAGELATRWQKDREMGGRELDAWEAFWEQQLLAAAADGDEQAGSGATEALIAIRQVRADLLGQVVPRMAIELMLVCFPRVTLESQPAQESNNVYA